MMLSCVPKWRTCLTVINASWPLSSVPHSLTVTTLAHTLLLSLIILNRLHKILISIIIYKQIVSQFILIQLVIMMHIIYHNWCEGKTNNKHILSRNILWVVSWALYVLRKSELRHNWLFYADCFTSVFKLRCAVCRLWAAVRSPIVLWKQDVVGRYRTHT